MGAISAVVLLCCLALSFFCAYLGTSLVFEPGLLRMAPSRARIRAAAQDARSAMLSIPLVARIASKAQEKRRIDDLQHEMPEVLRLLCIALESGSSLPAALRYAAQNSNGVLAAELDKTVWDLEAGHGFDEALERLRERTGGSEFAFLAVAMEIQHRSGGSLSDILNNVSTLLKQTSELKDDLRTKTAQGRLSSRIVSLMPFALLVILSLFSPGYLSGFLSSPLGICLFVFALLLEILGCVLVRRALAVDFSVDLEEAV